MGEASFPHPIRDTPLISRHCRSMTVARRMSAWLYKQACPSMRTPSGLIAHNKQRLFIAAYKNRLRLSVSGCLFHLLTALISYRAGRLACRLAGCLALSASALLHGFLQVSRAQCLNVLHTIASLLCHYLSKYSIHFSGRKVFLTKIFTSRFRLRQDWNRIRFFSSAFLPASLRPCKGPEWRKSGYLSPLCRDLPQGRSVP